MSIEPTEALRTEFTHQTEQRKIGALDLPAADTNWSQYENAASEDSKTAQDCEIAK